MIAAEFAAWAERHNWTVLKSGPDWVMASHEPSARWTWIRSNNSRRNVRNIGAVCCLASLVHQSAGRNGLPMQFARPTRRKKHRAFR